MKKIFLTLIAFSFLFAQAPDRINKKIDKMADRLEKKVINWRRDFHQNPELSNREFKTAEKVAKHLKSLGIEVQTGVAHTGVVGILKGGKPGKVVALRADMDALPVKEKVNLPFASKAKGIYQGNEVDVMHACGHDNHIAGMMGAAEILAGLSKTKFDESIDLNLQINNKQKKGEVNIRTVVNLPGGTGKKVKVARTVTEFDDFAVGDMVQHNLFGVGTIIVLNGAGENQKVGIGTSTANEKLEVLGGTRGGSAVVTGIATLTSYLSLIHI